MVALSAYLQKWNLKLSTTKTMLTAFHLYNKEAGFELKLLVEGQTLPFCVEPTYLRIKLDKAFTLHRRFQFLCKKLTTRNGLLGRLAGSSWGASATILRKPSLPKYILLLSTAHLFQCCRAHIRLTDKPIDDALHVVTSCLRPAPTDNLFIIAGIQPPELHCQKSIHSLVCRVQEAEHLLHERFLSLSFGHPRQLQSRHPFAPAALKLLNDLAQSGISVAQ